MVEALARAALPMLRRSDRLLDHALEAVGDASRTVKFLAGRAAFVPREDDVYVASYPRSGTTWACAILHLLASGADSLGFSHISEVVPWWERSLAYREDAPAALAQLGSPRVFKTHLPRRWLPRGARAIYLFRNPEDVAVSYFHLYRRYLRFEGSFADFFDRFLAGELQYRSWFRHVEGWRASPDDGRRLLVPYEELRASPRPWVARIAAFLGRGDDPQRIDEVVKLTDLQRMKAEQARFDHLGEIARQHGIREGDFIRQGKVSSGEGLLTPGQRAALERARASRPFLPALEWRLPSFLR